MHSFTQKASGSIYELSSVVPRTAQKKVEIPGILASRGSQRPGNTSSNRTAAKPCAGCPQSHKTHERLCKYFLRCVPFLEPMPSVADEPGDMHGGFRGKTYCRFWVKRVRISVRRVCPENQQPFISQAAVGRDPAWAWENTRVIPSLSGSSEG